MDLRDAVRILRRRWLSIVAVVVLALAVAAGLSYLQTPQYESDAQLFVSSASSSTNRDNGATYLNGLAATQKAPSYAELVTQSELTKAVVDDLRLDMTPAELASRLSATASTDSALIRISARDADAATAQRICSATAAELRSTIAEIETPPRSRTPLLQATVTDSASLPTSPVSPNVPLNLAVAMLLGLLLGLALAILRERTDTSVRSHAEIEEVLEASVLGSVNTEGAGGRDPLIENLKTYTPFAEAFRVIRTNLQFVDVDSPQKSLVVTSALPGEGKTTTAVNVAISLATAGQRVLLMDADLRRPRIAEYLHLEGAVGVTSLLLRRVGLDDAVQRHSSGLHLLASGPIPPNPAELLQSQAMSSLLGEVRARYDVVVIDSPPLLPVTDAALLAAQTDGALVVVRFGRTSRDQLASAASRLRGVGSRVLGTVINRVPTRARAYGYGYDYGYGYGYGPTSKPTSDAWTAPLQQPAEDDRTAAGAHAAPVSAPTPSGQPEGTTVETPSATGIPIVEEPTAGSDGDAAADGSEERLELSAFWRSRGAGS